MAEDTSGTTVHIYRLKENNKDEITFSHSDSFILKYSQQFPVSNIVSTIVLVIVDLLTGDCPY